MKVTVKVPFAAAAGSVRVALAVAVEPDRLTDDGETAQVAFGGPPAQPIATPPVNPPSPVTVSL